jgi:precorrin-6B methylase 2
MSDLRTVYDDFLRGRGDPHRQAMSAMGWESGVWLEAQLPVWGPRTILDLGSGWSSIIFRRYQASREVRVVTVDQHDTYLGLTRGDCGRFGLSTEDMVLLEGYRTRERFDLVCLDLAGTDHRLRIAPQVDAWLAEGGRIVLDDWHMDHYQPAMTAVLEGLGYTVEAIPETTDQFGRYLAVAQ